MVIVLTAFNRMMANYSYSPVSRGGGRSASTGEEAPDDEEASDGDCEQEQTDEERMRKEIAKQKGLIDALPGHTSLLDRAAPHQRKLGQLEFKYQLLLEKKRLALVLLKFQDLYGALYSERCLMCLDDIHVHAAEDLVKYFFCCGGFICSDCSADLRQPRCPLCREDLPTKDRGKRFLVKLAKRGVPWAQTTVGYSICFGIGGFEKDPERGVEWLNKAAAQNYPRALFVLYKLHRERLVPVLGKCQEEANKLLLKSANLGFGLANIELAKCHSLVSDGFRKNSAEAYFRASVAFALNEKDQQAAQTLGAFHNYESIPEPSPYLACHYLNIAANGDEDGIACHLYSDELLKLIERLHDGYIEIPGFDVIPAVLFWKRKSRDIGYSAGNEHLKQCEFAAKSYCGNCKKEAQGDEKFKQCSKCKAQWYCSKECQVEAWKAVHKKDCKSAGILNFEDYLDAECGMSIDRPVP
ncbi:hypothetical protein THAOC_18323 [Thalassiosira oceanica]|uniref:MYND-type domain-containing protein n=1 Tax=Thalassiosira oceanica TaxID=159749 RepID=K0S8K3_THAOC|nr:hypothetical protein THAOC_18323 [Thalassiosira oceanica]|eukprot:EJK61229.1 hypothetical protein THAOC_18323 [Thalassiosira oceanica]